MCRGRARDSLIWKPLIVLRWYCVSWSDGRRLTSATKGSTSFSFTYNDEGIRTSKTVDGVKHTYILDGSRIVSEQWDNKLMIFSYDENGAPIAIHYRLNGSAEDVFYTYYLEKNLQGDVIALYNSSGTKLVGYTYDAWGNCTTTYYNNGGSTGAQFNPFRYRGYYYDSDLGLYYLNSRYYDPNTGRFINADIHINANGDLIGFNMYAYCSNNPITFVDSTGQIASLIIISVVIAVATSVPSKEEHYNRNDYNIVPNDDELMQIVNEEHDDWVAADDDLNIYHRFTNGIQGEEAQYNKKYWSKDGRCEVIICYQKGKVDTPYIVTDPKNIGTYNYAPGTDADHFFKDVLPYWLWGNNEYDNTSRIERVVGN